MDALRLRGVFYFACHPALHLRLASVNDVDVRLLTVGEGAGERGGAVRVPPRDWRSSTHEQAMQRNVD